MTDVTDAGPGGSPDEQWDPLTAEPWPDLRDPDAPIEPEEPGGPGGPGGELPPEEPGGPAPLPPTLGFGSVPSSGRGGRKVRLVVVHTAEGARTAPNLRDFFVRTQTASSHVAVDAGQVLRLLDDGRAAWTVRSGNAVSVNAELCAFAAFSREQWLSTSTVKGCASPRAILDNTARWIADSCKRHGVPIRKISPAQVAAGQSGVIGHVDWTNGMHDGTHTDPGGSFPWDYVINRAAGGGAPIEEEFLSALSDAQQKTMLDNLDLLRRVVATRYPTDAVNGEMQGGKWAGDTGETVRAIMSALGRIEQRLDALERK